MRTTQLTQSCKGWTGRKNPTWVHWEPVLTVVLLLKERAVTSTTYMSQPQMHQSQSESKGSIHENYQVLWKKTPNFQCRSWWEDNVKYDWVLESGIQTGLYTFPVPQSTYYSQEDIKGVNSTYCWATDKTLWAVTQPKPSWPDLRKCCSSDTFRNPGANNQSSLGLVFPTRLRGFWGDC